MSNTRRLSSGAALKNRKATAPAIVLDENDDDAELQQLQKTSKRTKKRVDLSDEELEDGKETSAHGNAKKRKTNAITSTNDVENGELDDSDFFARKTNVQDLKTNQQLAELYDKCLKLCSENKINAKNAWALPLIGYMEVLTTNEPQSDSGASAQEAGPNFQRASVALDASVKIYSVRVDSLHSDTYKALGGLSRADVDEDERRSAEKREEGQQGDDLEPGEDGEYQEEEKKVKQKRAKHADRGVNTLETNVANLNAKKIDLEFSVDPLFRKTSAAFDEGGARGLLLNHLTVHNGCEIIFDSSDAINHDKQDPSDFVKPSNDIDLKEFRDLFAVQMRGTDTSKLRICPEYANYRFSSHDAVETLDEVELAADTEAALIEDDGVHVDDEAFNLAFGGQGDINYDGDADLDAVEARLETEMEAMAFPPAKPFDHEPVSDDDEAGHDHAPAFAALDDMFDVDGTNPLANDYVYFDVSKLNNWAGPQHWKFKKTVPPAQRKRAAETTTDENGELIEEDGEGQGEKKSRKRKQFFIDFSTPLTTKEFEKLVDTTGTTASTTLSAATLTNQVRSAASLTLAPDLSYEAKNLQTLFTKSNIAIQSKKRRQTQFSLQGNGTNFGQLAMANGGEFNPMDSDAQGMHDNDDIEPLPFEPAMSDDIDAPSNDVDALATVQDATDNTTGFAFGGGLQLVQPPKRLQVDVINYAKVDKRIDVKGLKRTIWNELCTPSSGATQQQAPDTMTEEKDFNTVLQQLPKSLDSNTLRDISVPYCFVCLLHLANEKHLELVQDGISKLSIRQTPPLTSRRNSLQDVSH